MAATVEIVYRADKKGKAGTAPIHIRITKDRKVHYIATGHKLHESYWDFDRKRIKSSYPNSARLKHYLNSLKVKYQDDVLELETLTTTISSKSLKSKITGTKPMDFFEVAEMIIVQYQLDNKTRSRNSARSVLSKLREFCKSTTLPFQEITPMFLTRYEQYLKINFHNKINTIDKDMRFIRRVINEADRLEVLGTATNPFKKYKSKKEKTERNYLTEEELTKIENVPLGKRDSLFRDIFIFASYVGGLRISDLILLNWNNYDGSHINLTVRKTGAQLSIKIPEKGIAIINKYHQDTSTKRALIFPVLNAQAEKATIDQIDKSISSATAMANNRLKHIAKLAGVEKTVTTHVARHTWATRALRKGISIDKVSKLMGHAAIKETQIYAKIVNTELDSAMDNFN